MHAQREREMEKCKLAESNAKLINLRFYLSSTLTQYLAPFRIRLVTFAHTVVRYLPLPLLSLIFTLQSRSKEKAIRQRKKEKKIYLTQPE